MDSVKCHKAAMRITVTADSQAVRCFIGATTVVINHCTRVQRGAA